MSIVDIDMTEANQPTLYILYEEDHWDVPLSGLGYYQNQLVWFYPYDQFEVDDNTGERLSEKELHQRNSVLSRLYQEFKQAHDNNQPTDKIEAQIDDIDYHETIIYSIHQLQWFNKITALFNKKKFEVFIGKHWSWDKKDQDGNRQPFRMNRWFGLGRLLFKLYFRRNQKQKSHKQITKHIDRYKSNPIIDFVRLENCKFGKPENV